ncbi:hypothetical protein BwSH20_75590 [Bradyrhizobium ottawaense]|nr:hypothetical protein BJA01nite_49900 [Bradyrhizobium japonicum]GMO10748.1 hypothetical protein BwSH20_75590 [Bradyrhizobium ottawaense]GMO17363.1 hypothetical protein BwSF12_03790 [Bradyrhizobium ottawaense]GMO49105.1 hypothetical protein BwSH14_68650 [Bradyrhizobium ottawaense]GMO50482.1 hypothetical protein BwSF21_72100 [Bradyrhizobium ottawaense]
MSWKQCERGSAPDGLGHHEALTLPHPHCNELNGSVTQHMVVLQLMRCPCHAPVKPNDSLSSLAYRKLTDLRSNLQRKAAYVAAGS